MSSAGQDDAPALRVVRGDAEPAELAALVTVLSDLAARRTRRDGEPDAPASAWTDRAASLRGPLPHGRGAWHASSWPLR